MIQRFLFVAAACALFLVPFSIARVPSAIVVLGILPAIAMARRTGLSPLGTAALTLTMSPILFGLVMLLAMWFGAGATAGVWIATALAALGYILFYASPAGGGNDDPEASGAPDPRGAARGLAAVFLVAAVLAFTLPLVNDWWRFREDSWFHAAVTHRLTQHGMPPVDPYFSPLRLQYMYFYHVLLSGAKALTRLDPFYCMILLNAMALAGFVLGFDLLARQFTRKPLPRVLGSCLAVFGMNGLFFAFFPIRLARAFAGETSGGDVLKHFFTLSPPSHATAASFLSIEGNQFLFLDKFMLGTAFSLTLGLLCVLLAMLMRAQGAQGAQNAQRGQWGRHSTLTYMTALTGMMFLHLVVGVTAWVATMIVVIFNRRLRTLLLAPTTIPLIIAAPYIYGVMPRDGSSSITLAFQWRQAVGIASDILPVLVLALPLIVRKVREAGVLTRWALVVLAIALTADLTTVNETKFSYPLFIALAGLAVGGLDRALSSREWRRFTIALVIVATVPLNAIYFYCAFHDRSTFEITDSERAVYAWIEQNTEPDALFLEDFDIVRIPVLARRNQYWGTNTYANNWGYPKAEMDLRSGLRDKAYSRADSLTAADFSHAAQLGRPFYIIYRGATGDYALEKLRHNPLLEGRFIVDDMAVFELKTP